MTAKTIREGSLDAPTRHPLDWQSGDFYNEEQLNHELERVYDICHGCRRCVSLCDSFPTLFDLVDDSPTMEVDGIDKADYKKVAEQCYLCDLCYMTKCPYVPPHEWNVDFLHLMLRAKAVEFKQHGASLRNKILTDTDTVGRLASIPMLDVTVNTLKLAKLVDQGFDLIAPIPSCVLMYKQELPLMFPHDAEVKKVQAAFFDPFEYLFLRHKAGQFKTDFKQGLGNIAYQIACHLRVQNIGLKTRDILQMIPDTDVNTLERCSGHDGTYAVKLETREKSIKIARPLVSKINKMNPNHVSSDCPMAATQLANLSYNVTRPTHPMTLLRQAYTLTRPEI